MNQGIDALSRRYWERRLDRDPVASLACAKAVEHIYPVSPEAAAADAAFGRSVLAQLDGAVPDALTEQERVTAEALRFDAQMLVDKEPFFWHEPLLGAHAQPFASIAPVFSTFAFQSDSDCDRYRSLLEDFARAIGALEEFAAQQMLRGLTMPAAAIDPAVRRLRSCASADAAAFLIPGLERLRAVKSASAAAIREASARAVEERIVPAFRRLAVCVDGAYRAAAREHAGCSRYENGDAFYAHLVRRVTTLDPQIDRMHVLGITELERIGEELDRVRADLRFAGGPAEFYRHLRTDVRFFASNAAEIGERLEMYVRRAMQRVPEYFGVLPAAPWRIEPLPESPACTKTFGHYRPPTPAAAYGTYFFSASRPRTRSLLSAGALVLRELAPGHHLQAALAQEHPDLPPLRRYSFSAALWEGYAEYAAELGFEMGVYAEPYERAGRLMQDALVSCRLVVDTGMNALGWTLDQAQQFMHAHTLLSAGEIARETLRYGCDLPARGVAYKAGEIAILQARERARSRYGALFDIRAFHDWLLGNGAVPLTVL